MPDWKEEITKRLRSLKLAPAREVEIVEEVAQHLEDRYQELVAGGTTEEEARRVTLEELSDENLLARGLRRVEQEATQEPVVPGAPEKGNILAGIWQDVRYGLRQSRRNPGFTLVAVLTLALGIGANATVMSWIEGILLRPYLAVAHQERMMAITGTRSGVPGEAGSAYDLSWPDFQDLERNCKLFDAFIVSRIMGTTLSVGDRAEVAAGSIVSSNYFTALGVRPILGRGFQPDEDQGRNAHPVTVISYDLWQRRFNGDPSIVGRTQTLNGQVHTIIGVAPPGFYGTFVGWAMDFYVPVSMQERFDPTGYKLEDRGGRWIEGYVMLKPGITPAQSQQEISAVASQLESGYPITNRGRGVMLYPLWRTPFNNAGTLLPTLNIALAVVVFVLFIVCANVSNLLLVRGFARRHEMTVRLALGAKRRRLLGQLLTEGFILSVLATAGGVMFANWGRNLLVLLLPGGSRMNLAGAIDWRVLVVSSVICLVTTVVFGLVAALQASDIDIARTLKSESGSVVGGGRRKFVQSSLVLVQVALSFTLLVGAGLLLASLREMQSTRPGFDDSHLLTGLIDFNSAGYTPERAWNFQDQIVDRLEALPGVQSAAFARITPFEYRGYSSAPVAVDGSQAPPDALPTIEYNEVGPQYLATMGIPLISGREFTRADNESSPLVAIVNDVMAAQLWPQQDPVGRRIQVKGRWMRVVGLAKATKYRTLLETPQPFFYVPLRQSKTGVIMQIRTELPPDTIAQSLIRETHALDQSLAPAWVAPMTRQIERTTAPQKAALLMISVFAGLALLLATVGLYGVMSYTVAQSTRELGLRIALGAAPSDLLRLVMLRGVRLTVAGVLAGAVVALASSRLLGYLLYHVSPHDPMIFASAFLLVSAAAFAASFIPAWRASRADPLNALRT